MNDLLNRVFIPDLARSKAFNQKVEVTLQAGCLKFSLMKHARFVSVSIVSALLRRQFIVHTLRNTVCGDNLRAKWRWPGYSSEIRLDIRSGITYGHFLERHCDPIAARIVAGNAQERPDQHSPTRDAQTRRQPIGNPVSCGLTFIQQKCMCCREKYGGPALPFRHCATNAPARLRCARMQLPFCAP